MMATTPNYQCLLWNSHPQLTQPFLLALFLTIQEVSNCVIVTELEGVQIFVAIIRSFDHVMKTLANLA